MYEIIGRPFDMNGTWSAYSSHEHICYCKEEDLKEIVEYLTSLKALGFKDGVYTQYENIEQHKIEFATLENIGKRYE